MRSAVLAAAIGIVATSQLHIAKVLTEYGSRSAERPPRRHGRLAWALGFALNCLTFAWAMLANTLAPSSYFTAMFGFGLLVHVAARSRILGVRAEAGRYLGALVAAAGTGLCAAAAALAPAARAARGRPGLALLAAAAAALSLALLVGLSLRGERGGGRPSRGRAAAAAWGALVGLGAGLDPFLKGIAQGRGRLAAPGLVPVDALGWALLVASFIVGGVAFALTLVGFAKGLEGGTMTGFSSAGTVLFPIALNLVAEPGLAPSPLLWIGTLVVAAGIGLMELSGASSRRTAGATA